MVGEKWVMGDNEVEMVAATQATVELEAISDSEWVKCKKILQDTNNHAFMYKNYTHTCYFYNLFITEAQLK